MNHRKSESTKAWALWIPTGDEYASMVPLYDESTEMPVLCGLCARTTIERLLVEWDDGSDVVGDFVHAMGRIVVQSRVANRLLKHFTGFKKGAVEMYDHPNLRLPKRVTRRTARRVWLPYDGPKLCELVISREVPLHPKSTVEIEFVCRLCGRIQCKAFLGVAEKSLEKTIRRKQGKGLFFRKQDLKGSDLFRPKCTGWNLCTDRAKQFMRKEGYTNIEFLEVGDILGE